MADDYAGDRSTTGSLPVGGTVRGTLEETGDTDWFKLDLKANHGYLFTPTMTNGRVPSLTIWNADANWVVYTSKDGALNTNDLVNPFVPSRSGTYFLEVDGEQTGGYQVGVREAPDDAGNDPAAARLLTSASAVAGHFDYAFDKDQFRIPTVAGMTYTVTLSADSGSLGTASYLRLRRDEEGDYSESFQGFSSVSHSFTADRTGDYLVSAVMASFYPPADGGLAYHVSVSATDRTGPKVVAGTGTVDGNIVLTLDEAAFPGPNGDITLYMIGGHRIGSWAPGDAGLHISGNTITLDASDVGALMPGRYEVRISRDIVVDASGNGNGYKTESFNTINVSGTKHGGIALGSGDSMMHMSGSASSEDAAVFHGKRSDFTIVREGDGFKVVEGNSLGKILSGIERVLFTQSTEVVALSLDGTLGQAFRLYTAAFDRAPDAAGLGFWLDVAERGVSLPEMARGFIASQEFVDLYGARPDDAAFVAALYENVLHRPGDAGGVRYWMDALGRGADRGDVLASFSESKENQDQAVELIGNGIVYTPYG